MKKRIFPYAILFSTLLGFSSCQESILELTPPSTLTEANFYKSSNDLNLAVIGVYSSYQARLPQDWTLSEMPTDNIHRTGYFNIGGLDEVNTISFTSQNPLFASFWINTYNAIFRANAVIRFIDQPTDFTGTMKNQLLGEAKFLRALFYFDLVKRFGGVPLVTSYLSVEESRSTGRATEDEVYNFVINELKEAITLLPARDQIAKGRAHQSAATALLGKVLVYRKQWQEASTYLSQVTTQGFALQSSYASLWQETTEDNDEVVFGIKYLPNTNGHALSTDFLPYFGVAGIASRGNENAFPSWSLMKKFKSTDTRKAATITEYWKAPTSGSDVQPYWYPYVRKFANTHTAGSSGLDIPVIRYADIILLRAEALYFSGQKAEALQELNKVRQRAFGNSSENYTLESIEAEQDFMDKLLLERQLEFALEGERWFDLVRTGRYMTDLKTIEWSYNPVTQESQKVNFSVSAHMKYFPIPLNQIDLANQGVLQQNPGY